MYTWLCIMCITFVNYLVFSELSKLGYAPSAVNVHLVMHHVKSVNNYRKETESPNKGSRGGMQWCSLCYNFVAFEMSRNSQATN